MLYKDTLPGITWVGETGLVSVTFHEKGGLPMSDDGSGSREQRIDTESTEPPSVASSPLIP